MKSTEFLKAVESVFYAYYQRTIDEMRVGHPQYGDMTNAALIHIQDDFIDAEIKQRNVYFNFEKLSETQLSVYYKALVQQIYYVLTEGDFASMSGYDVTTNTFAPKAELKARTFSTAAKMTLENGGLFYPGLGAPLHRNLGWRW